MSEDYVIAKIREALLATDQDKRDAQKLLITWAVRDQSLLLGLAKPHLKGIISAQIEHYLGESEGKGKGTKTHFTLKDAEAMASSSRPMGDKRSHLPPPKSSVRQASVMQQIADAYKKGKEK